jgi:hypothetical protein
MSQIHAGNYPKVFKWCRIGGNGNTSTGAGGYQLKGNARHAPEFIPAGGTRYVRMWSSIWSAIIGGGRRAALSTPIPTASSPAVTAAGAELKPKRARPSGSAQECGMPHSCSNDLTTEGLTPSLVITAASASS